MEQEAGAAATARLSAAAELAGAQSELKQLQQEKGRTTEQRASVLEACARSVLHQTNSVCGVWDWLYAVV